MLKLSYKVAWIITKLEQMFKSKLNRQRSAVFDQFSLSGTF